MTKLCDRVLKAAAIRVQSPLECNDPAYRACARIAEDITTVTASEAQWQPDDPVDEAVAEIQARIVAALGDEAPALMESAESADSVEQPAPTQEPELEPEPVSQPVVSLHGKRGVSMATPSRKHRVSQS